MKLSHFKVTVEHTSARFFFTGNSIPTSFNVRCMEFPPHHRTLKLTYATYENGNFTKQIYVQLPYTQLYFTNFTLNRAPLVLLSATQIALNKNPTIPPFRSVYHNCAVCWGTVGFSNTLKTFSDIQLADKFWNSSFEILCDETNQIYKARTFTLPSPFIIEDQ